jgi:hypothetical protein
VAIQGWSNWTLPFLERGRLDLANLDLQLVGVNDFPAVGDFRTICEFIADKIQVDTEDTEDTMKELQAELDPNQSIRVDDDHA